MIGKELMLEIIPLELNEQYDEYYETKFGNSLSVGYCYNIVYNGARVGCGAKHFNIFELSDKCKDWALSNGFEIYSKRTKYKGVAKIKKYIDGSKRKKLICCKIADTEIQAIFDICQWILDNKKGKVMKEIKVGDVYFENEILKVVYTNGWYPGHFMYEMDFLGHISRYSCSKESIDKTIRKRIAAYALIPDGCKVIPADMIGMFSGLLIGGIMEDSIKRVHGICENGIRGFSCSVFFVPSKAYLNSIMEYGSILGDFKIK